VKRIEKYGKKNQGSGCDYIAGGRGQTMTNALERSYIFYSFHLGKRTGQNPLRILLRMVKCESTDSFSSQYLPCNNLDIIANGFNKTCSVNIVSLCIIFECPSRIMNVTVNLVFFEIWRRLLWKTSRTTNCIYIYMPL
jgi:hypothetical protein